MRRGEKVKDNTKNSTLQAFTTAQALQVFAVAVLFWPLPAPLLFMRHWNTDSCLSVFNVMA